MVRSVEEILKSEFGRSLSNKDVHTLDPFVGTGNFITRVMQEIKTSRLPQQYKEGIALQRNHAAAALLHRQHEYRTCLP